MNLEKLLQGVAGGVLGLVFLQNADAQKADTDAALKSCAGQVIREHAPRGAKISRDPSTVFGDVFSYSAHGEDAFFQTGVIVIAPGKGGPGSLLTHSLQSDNNQGALAGIEADKKDLDRPGHFMPSANLDDTHNPVEASLTQAAKTTSAKLLDGMRQCMRMDLTS